MKKSEKEVCSNPENICMNPEKLSDKNKKFDAKNYWESQLYAISGLQLIVKNERNFRYQLVFSILVVIAGFVFRISHADWVAVAVVIAIVLVSEAFNSVVEAICDTISKDYRINIRYAKDVSAGAVLVSALVAVFAGILIFLPYVWEAVERILNAI